MPIIIAQPHGFCGQNGRFGVSGAIQTTQQAAQDFPGRVYILGDLVHNDHVTTQLKTDFGVTTVQSLAEIPATNPADQPNVLVIKSHGLPPQTIQAAEAKGLQLVDATCAMVRQVHLLVKKLASEGKKIIYVASDLQHEEARGVYGEAPDQITLVTLDQLPTLTLADPTQTIVLTQTTLSVLETQAALAALKLRYPELTIEPHICPATTQRQQAVIELSAQADLMIIVGAPHSSNSQRLAEAAQQAAPDKPVYIIDSIAEFQDRWLLERAADLGLSLEQLTIGLSAGASTPEAILDQIVIHLQSLIKTHSSS